MPDLSAIYIAQRSVRTSLNATRELRADVADWREPDIANAARRAVEALGQLDAQLTVALKRWPPSRDVDASGGEA